MIKSYSIAFFFIFFLLLIFVSHSCKEDSPVIPPPPLVLKDTITIAVTDVTHRSASLNVQCTMNNVQSLVRLYRLFNSSETLVSEFPITAQDTTIIDDNNGTGLQLNTNYFYYAVRIDTTGERKDTSNIVETATLDTTSHNYTWQEYVIGEWQSALYDVWGTDENNVYAVGIIRMNGQNYSVLHYDGVEWSPIEDTVGGSSIFGVSSTDIWVVGGGVYHLENGEWTRKDAKSVNNQLIPLDAVLFNNSPYTSVWGTSSSNLYLGNEWGKIIHWDGSKASVVSSSEGETIKNIDGISSDFIIGVGTDLTPPGITVYYNGLSWSNYPNVDNTYSLNSVAIINQKNICFGGDGIFQTKRGGFSKIVSTGYYVRDIEYNKATGEIVAAGDFDGVHIYNGMRWKSFKEEITNSSTSYFGIFTVNNKVFCVGRNNSQAVIVIGTRN